MKKLLVLPLLLGFTSPVLANTWVLLGHAGKGKSYTVKMVSKEQCEEQGQRFIDKRNWTGNNMGLMLGYICIKGRNK